MVITDNYSCRNQTELRNSVKVWMTLTTGLSVVAHSFSPYLSGSITHFPMQEKLVVLRANTSMLDFLCSFLTSLQSKITPTQACNASSHKGKGSPR
jgi:hypothetical protein